jgi:hypothetical protein
MDHRSIDGADVVFLQTDEAFLLPGDRVNQWPAVVRVLEWHDGENFVQIRGHRADRNGDAILRQPTSEYLMLGHDSRLQHFPAWLVDALNRGSHPLVLA